MARSTVHATLLCRAALRRAALPPPNAACPLCLPSLPAGIPFDGSWDDFVNLSREIMRGRNSREQQETVAGVLAGLLPPQVRCCCCWGCGLDRTERWRGWRRRTCAAAAAAAAAGCAAAGTARFDSFAGRHAALNTRLQVVSRWFPLLPQQPWPAHLPSV